MKKQLVAAALSIGLLGPALTAPANANDGWNGKKKIKHVLLISVDGMHALDVANYVKNNRGSALAELAGHGITYSNAQTPANSDSFPGLLALVTGGTPVSHGLFYDVSYNRAIFDPTNPTCQGQAGNMQVFDESIDVYNSNNVSENVIDPTKLPHYINAQGKCALFFPHNAMQSNTIFEVVKAEGGRTAWADKHPAYDIVNGPSGKGVDDLFTPELTNAPGFDNTVSVVCTANNDELKVQAILNEIKGFNHDGSKKAGRPEVFGMNFQAVSVGQKLSFDNRVNGKNAGCIADTDPSIDGQPGGYLDGAGTPTSVLKFGLDYVDGALGRMITALKSEGIYDSTLFIVSAKHGQSPINPVKVNKPGHFADLVAALPDAADPAAQAIATANGCGTGNCGFVQDDDIALIWLAAADQSKSDAVAAYLNKHANDLFIDEVMAGEEIKLKFRDPLHDSRTPDILVQPIYGTIYTTSSKKNAEHGGFSFGDTNVGLIVSNPEFDAQVVKTPVTTAQVAATLLQALGIDPSELDAVRKEGTVVLPFAAERAREEE
ncbi:MAG TPA: alkaline phosphatase family protein [Candidatus Acidoferrales bacterium]|nr:alkaline phosphatase family protein [Candidatus Acidoferrales bacterium]